MNDNRDMNNRMEYYDEYEIDLREYIMLIWEHKWFITAFVIIAVLVAFFVSSYFINPLYSLQATVKLANAEGIYSETEPMSELLSSSQLIDPVLEDLNLSRSFFKNYETEIISELSLTDQGMQGAVYGGIIQINAKANNPDELQKAVNGILADFKDRSDQYFDKYLEDKVNYLNTLKAELNRIDNKIEKTNELLDGISNIDADQAYLFVSLNDQLNNLEENKREYLKDVQELEREISDYREFSILNPPQVPQNPVSPNIRLNIAIAAVLALMLAVFIIFFKEFMKEEE